MRVNKTFLWIATLSSVLHAQSQTDGAFAAMDRMVQSADGLVINVCERNGAWEAAIGQTVFTRTRLELFLRSVAGVNPGLQVNIRSYPGTSWPAMAEIISLCSRAGFRDIRISKQMSEKEKE